MSRHPTFKIRIRYVVGDIADPPYDFDVSLWVLLLAVLLVVCRCRGKPMRLHEVMTEAQFQKWITDMAELHRWTWRHARDSRGQNLTDLPDLILIREPRLLFLEVKTMKGKVKRGQRIMLDRLVKCDVEAYLVRPSDRDFIRALLV